MNLFRDKLAREIEETEALIGPDTGMDQRIQTNIYCIAALLRRILARIDESKKVTVRVWEIDEDTGGHYNNIPLESISKIANHYTQFQPTTSLVRRTPTTVTLLGDRDNEPAIRDVDLRDFIDAARIVANDGDAIIDGVLRYTKKYLSTLNHNPTASGLTRLEGSEALIDAFDLIRESGRERWIDGKLTHFSVRINHENFAEVIGIQPSEVGYDVLFKNLFIDWFYIPFSQFRTYEKEDFGHGLRGKKVIEIERPDGSRITIRLDDVIAMLDDLENTLFGVSADCAPQ